MVPELPPGEELELPGRGSVFVRRLTGPRRAPTLVLVHGWTVTADLNWFASYAPLSKAFDVVAMDVRGHGRGVRSRWFHLEDCADDVVALADALGIERIVPVGYSMGGAIAQLVARRHPERVEALVLAATARQFHLKGDDPSFRRTIAPAVAMAATLTPDRVWQAVFDRLGQLRPQRDEFEAWAAAEFRRNDPAAMVQALAELQRFDSRAWIGGLDMPVGVVVTTNDDTVPTVRQRNLVAALEDPVVVEIDAPHRAAVERADLFVPALLRVCRAVSRRAAAGGAQQATAARRPA